MKRAILALAAAGLLFIPSVSFAGIPDDVDPSLVCTRDDDGLLIPKAEGGGGQSKSVDYTYKTIYAEVKSENSRIYKKAGLDKVCKADKKYKLVVTDMSVSGRQEKYTIEKGDSTITKKRHHITATVDFCCNPR